MKGQVAVLLPVGLLAHAFNDACFEGHGLTIPVTWPASKQQHFTTPVQLAQHLSNQQMGRLSVTAL